MRDNGGRGGPILEIREYADTLAAGRLGRHTVFELVCRQVVRAGLLGEDEERELLKKLQKFLRLPPDEAKEILQAARDLERPASVSPELPAAETFERACELAWEDGELDERELKILTGLATAMHVSTEEATRILDETFSRSMAALKAGAQAADAAAADAAAEGAPGEGPDLSLPSPDATPLAMDAVVPKDANEPPPVSEMWKKKEARKKEARQAAKTRMAKAPDAPPVAAPSLADMGLLPELVKGLFTEPQESLARSMHPESRAPTLAFGALGVLVMSWMSPLAEVGLDLAILSEGGHLALFVLAIHLGGMVTGGKGKFLPILQMVCLVAPVYGALHAALALVGLGFLIRYLAYVILYFLMKVGHGLHGWNDTRLAYATGFALTMMGDFALIVLVKKLALARVGL